MSRSLFLIPSLGLQFNIILFYSSNTHASWRGLLTGVVHFFASPCLPPPPPPLPLLSPPPPHPPMLHDFLESGRADASPIPTPWSLGRKRTAQLPNENLSHRECWNSLQFSEQLKNSLKLSSLEIPWQLKPVCKLTKLHGMLRPDQLNRVCNHKTLNTRAPCNSTSAWNMFVLNLVALKLEALLYKYGVN
jgi:hypothetical protein